MQKACVQVHVLLNSVWGCNSVPLVRHTLSTLFQDLLQTDYSLCAKTARISDLIWKEALDDDLVLPAAQWPEDVFFLIYTGAFNLLLYWDLFDFTYHYHNDMLVGSRASHGLCTVHTTNVIRLNYQGLSLGLLEINCSITFVICEPLTITQHSQNRPMVNFKQII